MKKPRLNYPWNPKLTGEALRQRISERTVRSCIEQGWAEPWFTNPLKPDWLVCKLTDEGRTAVGSH